MLAALFAALAVALAPASTANAHRPMQATTTAAVTCYGGAQDTGGLTLDVAIGPYFTSNRCSDVNVNLTQARFQTDGRSCLERVVNGRVVTVSCSAWKLLPLGAFTTLSTNVLDGTRFRVEFRGNNGERIRALVAA